MPTRREILRLLGKASALTLLGATADSMASSSATAEDSPTPALAAGTPLSPERTALIEAFKKQTEGLEAKFEARTHQSRPVMPYRLFRPEAAGRLPLVIYLHGSGGLGADNVKQMGLGNIFGTRVWARPENQKRFPCYVAVPQTDQGWVRYDLSQTTPGPAEVLPGLGPGARLAFEIIDRLLEEFSIDERRIYIAGQSMGGAGAWHMIAHRPSFFAAAVVCCGSSSTDDGSAAIDTPLWNFHGDSDQTVPVSVSRDRIAARRKAGGRPLSTEYARVDHPVWQWAFTEPALLEWVFAQRRSKPSRL